MTNDIERIPNFDENGNLPPGLIKNSLPNFKIKFVEEFPGSKTRRIIFNGYIIVCNKIIDLNIATQHWINGSYTSSKVDPSDVDFVTHINAQRVNQMGYDPRLTEIFSSNQIKADFKCHSFFIRVYPKTDLRYLLTKKERNYWLKWFGHDRLKNEKGIVEIDLSVPENISDYKREGGQK